MLHWHWAWPEPGIADLGHDGDGPRLHAHLGPDALPAADPGVTATADTSIRGSAPIALGSPVVIWATVLAHLDLIPPRPAIPGLATRGRLFASRTSMTARLHRWTC